MTTETISRIPKESYQLVENGHPMSLWSTATTNQTYFKIMLKLNTDLNHNKKLFNSNDTVFEIQIFGIARTGNTGSNNALEKKS